MNWENIKYKQPPKGKAVLGIVNSEYNGATISNRYEIVLIPEDKDLENVPGKLIDENGFLVRSRERSRAKNNVIFWKYIDSPPVQMGLFNNRVLK